MKFHQERTDCSSRLPLDRRVYFYSVQPLIVLLNYFILKGIGVTILLCLLVIQMPFCVRSCIIITCYVTLINDYSSKFHLYSYWVCATSLLVHTFNVQSSMRLGSISHTGTSMMFCPWTTQSLRFTWARCIPLNSRSKTRQRATLLLLTWIYFCRSGGTVYFTLPFMTNVTISISTSQISRSWVAIFQPRPPMASWFRSLYGLAPRMDILSWGRRDLQISFSNRDTSRNAFSDIAVFTSQ